jgi:hypothetical protein
MNNTLTEERKFFSENQAKWKTAHRGKFVLIKGRELIGTYDQPEDAVAEGARLFGIDSFLVRCVDHSEEEIYIPALALGLLDARSPQSV